MDIFACFFFGLLAIGLFGLEGACVYRDFNPTPQQVAERKTEAQCKNKCDPNYGHVYNGRCLCHNEWKEAK